jgi:cytochrome c oxidase cbb3-type subunit 3
LLSIASGVTYAQSSGPAAAVQVATNTDFGPLPGTTMLVLSSVIALEVIIILAMLGFLKQMLAKDKPVVVAELKIPKEPFYSVWWKKLNNLQPQTAEAALMLDHDYDGIRELDNKLPPWWLYGFYACIIFSFVYLYRYHVSHSAPLSLEEYQIAMVEAEKEKEAYLASSANNVDENTVQLLTDVSALEEGRKLFSSMCAACHGLEGQGTVGPNLTDDYWLHSGGIKDIFKSIKYGIPEKGMKSWKDDFSPVQIAALASLVKSLRGSKPANPKEPQGELYKEAGAATPDSTKAVDKRLVKN